MKHKLIVEWADTKKTDVKTFKSEEELIEFASLAVMLNAKVCMKFAGLGWVWSQ